MGAPHQFSTGLKNWRSIRMTAFCKEDYIEELRANIRDKDPIKADILLSHLEGLNAKGQSRVAFELSRAEDDFAILLLGKWIAGNPGIIATIPELRQTFLDKVVEHPSALVEILDTNWAGESVDLYLLLLDALAATSDPDLMEKLCSALASPSARIRKDARAKLIKKGTAAFPLLAMNLASDNADLLVQTLDVLGAVADEGAIPLIRRLLQSAPSDPNVRFAAYDALGQMPVRKCGHILTAGLEDPVDSVAMAAARTIDENLDDLLAGGVQNITENSGHEAARMARIVIDSGSERLFLRLFEGELFQKYSKRYLAGSCHEEIKQRFEEILGIESPEKSDVALFTDQPPQRATEEKTATMRVWAVDDSRMILQLYKSFLRNLGYNIELYLSPLEAWDALQADRPDLLLTDLNMPGMTGVELVRKVREIHPMKKLPIIMITTQGENDDHQEAVQAGVNRIFQKPFTEEQLGEVIDEELSSQPVRISP